MKRFKWKLQRLLDVKSRQEELKKAQLLALVQNIAAVRQNLLMRQPKSTTDFCRACRAICSAAHCKQQQLFLKAVAFADEKIKTLKQTA